MKRRGIDAIDGRSKEARALKTRRSELVEEHGGEEALSPRVRTLIEIATQDAALLGHANEWIQKNGGEVIDKRERAFAPIVVEKGRVADRLASTLRELESLRPTPKTMTTEEAEQSLRRIFGDDAGNALIETAAEGFSPAAMNAIERGDFEGFVAVLTEELQENAFAH